VRAVIRSLLPTQALSIERVARLFGCSGRTLQRWLERECGVTYNALVEDVRFDLAQQFLAQSNRSVTDISLAVGYSNPTNFTRSFKKVIGCSPREWRKRQKIHA
jgi:AraC-like DNA-binding protein